MKNPDTVFAEARVLETLFPESRSDEFFDALFGDATEGAYNIQLRYGAYDAKSGTLTFFLDLLQRPGKCLACNLTSGLPDVFARHPVINIRGLVAGTERLLEARCTGWELGRTRQEEPTRYCIPLVLSLSGS